MNILVIGHGGREHALIHAFRRSPSVKNLHAIPGNDGMRSGENPAAMCHNLDWKDSKSLVEFCRKQEISYVFIGPEDPLVAGLCDKLREAGIPTVGPSQAAAHLEASKIFSKNFMLEAKIPTSAFAKVSSVQQTMQACESFAPPYVLKADGLCAGRGVFICKTKFDLESAAKDLFENKIFGDAGSKAILEQFIPGWELSYLVVTNGLQFVTLPLSQDHKRLLENDAGPNTGGMGTIAPIEIDLDLHERIKKTIVGPTLELLKKKEFLYYGVLYFGLMITDQGPQLLEYNCRFGDPETQVILPLLDQDIAKFFQQVAMGEIPNLKIKNSAAACVILASPGYPMNPQKELLIEGNPTACTDSSYFIHAGAKFQDGTWKTAGGRVLCAIGIGQTHSSALAQAYSQAKMVRWPGLQMRMDIGKKTFVNRG